jgi:hypothetical protein
MKDLVLETWDKLNHAEQSALAGRVAARWRDFQFTGLNRYSLGGIARSVALFDLRGIRFVLVPGAPDAGLGWDRSPVRLSESRREAWRSAVAAIEGECDVAFEAHLDLWLRPARRVAVPPLLVEVTPRRLRDLADPYELDVAAVRALATGGKCRLPTADEWEWLCRGGSLTLFRWGNEWPEGLPLGDGSFDLHRAPNAFGLELLADPYAVECVEEMDCFVGGDGGTALCGDRPEPEMWVSFTSSYRYPGEHIDEYAFPEFLDGASLRRVLPLDL